MFSRKCPYHSEQSGTLVRISQCIFAVNAVLTSAIRMHQVDKAYIEFSIRACSRGASIGHRMVKVAEKDARVSYDTEYNALQKELGSTTGHRMNARITTSAAGKWKVLDKHFEEDIASSFALLNDACNQPNAKLPGKPIRHLRCILAGAPRNAGLGIDQQILRQWAQLPDDAIKGLLLIIRAMLECKCAL